MKLYHKLIIVSILSLLLIIVGCSKDTGVSTDISVEITKEIEAKCGDSSVIKDLCIFDLAVENQDENFCLALSTEDNKNSCLGNIKKDSSFCEKIVNKIEAHYWVLSATPEEADPAFCETLEELDKELCLSATAFYKKDAEVCKKIVSDFSRNICLNDVAKESANPVICEELADEYNTNQCLKEVAIVKQDELICNQITTGTDLELYENTRDKCFREVSLEKEDKVICEQIENSDIKNWCLASFEKTKDLCQKIDDVTIKFDCFIDVAKETKDVSICEDIVSLGKKDECFQKVAFANQDKAICDKISSTYAKDNCIWDIDNKILE